MRNTIPNMEMAYQKLRPIFLQALGKLSRQGFAVYPVDSLDLIHDFFAEAWGDVTRNYDSDKGPFENYAYVAFVHFARPRIVEIRRLQNIIVDYDTLMKIIDEKLSIQPDFVLLPDLGTIGESISRLPEVERDVLKAYFGLQSPSERELARTFGLSRYKLKETLLSGMGKVLISLDRPAAVREGDWQVALALWRNARSFNEAARCLGVTVHQVKESNSRNLRFVAQVLRDYQSWSQNRSGRHGMSVSSSANVIESLFTQALRSQGNHDLLREIQKMSDQILTAMEGSTSFGPAEEELKDIDPSWLAEVYYALSGLEEVSVEEETPFWATKDKEESIGEAFKVLVAGLPKQLQQFGSDLGFMARVEEEEIQELLNTPAAKAARPFSEYLAERGLTPLSIFYATDAVSYLIERLAEQELIPRGVAITLEEEMVKVDGRRHEVLTLDFVVDEIDDVSAASQEASREVYKWLIQVAQYRPFLFPGFLCEPAQYGKGALLVKSHRAFENLFQRWGLDVAALEERRVGVTMS